AASLVTRVVTTARPTTQRVSATTLTSSSGPGSVAAATCHSRMPIDPCPATSPQASATIRIARVVTGSNATTAKPSLVRSYRLSPVSSTSCQPVPSWYWRTQLRGGIITASPVSGVSRYHHTPARSTVTANAQSRRAHCCPARFQVPQLEPYFAALFSKRSLDPSLSPPTFSHEEV